MVLVKNNRILKDFIVRILREIS